MRNKTVRILRRQLRNAMPPPPKPRGGRGQLTVRQIIAYNKKFRNVFRRVKKAYNRLPAAKKAEILRGAYLDMGMFRAES